MAGLEKAGASVGYYSAATAGEHAADFEAARSGLGLSHLWFDQPRTGDAAAIALRGAVTDFAPELILAYGPEPLRLVRKSAPDAVRAIMSVDLEHLPTIHRSLYNLRHGTMRQRLSAIRHGPAHLWLAARTYFDIRAEYPKAAFVINHAAHHANWHAKRHGVPVLYTPNPLMETRRPVRQAEAGDVPKLVLLGGIGGIATLTGLQWFADKVYPLIETALVNRDFEVHLIGRGELDKSLDRKLAAVVRRGYVENIKDVFGEATAILVPTPITLGFRTRIVDAFRHGVTVVAHSANGAGMPELKHGANALVATSPETFAAAMRQLAADPRYAQRLGDAALEQFRSSMSSEIVAKAILEFAQRQQQQG